MGPLSNGVNFMVAKRNTPMFNTPLDSQITLQ